MFINILPRPIAQNLNSLLLSLITYVKNVEDIMIATIPRIRLNLCASTSTLRILRYDTTVVMESGAVIHTNNTWSCCIMNGWGSWQSHRYCANGRTKIKTSMVNFCQTQLVRLGVDFVKIVYILKCVF